MLIKVTVAFPYSLKETFDSAVRGRLSELRSVALEAFGGDKDNAWKYLCSPRKGWGDERSLFEQSLSSDEGHQAAITAIRQMEYGVYV